MASHLNQDLRKPGLGTSSRYRLYLDTRRPKLAQLGVVVESEAAVLVEEVGIAEAGSDMRKARIMNVSMGAGRKKREIVRQRR